MSSMKENVVCALSMAAGVTAGRVVNSYIRMICGKSLVYQIGRVTLGAVAMCYATGMTANVLNKLIEFPYKEKEEAEDGGSENSNDD